MKVPIETLPVELRIKIYELGDVRTITDTYIMSNDEDDYWYLIPWTRTILMSGILNDKDAIEIAAIVEKSTPSCTTSYTFTREMAALELIFADIETSQV